jgi:hypothetical protein
MTDFELKLAFIEYDIAITNINYTKVHGFQFQIDDFEYHCSKKKLKETYKLDVMFQTDFLEETYKDFLYNERDINKTMQKLSKWHYDLLNNNEASIDWDNVIFSANPNNLQSLLILHSNKMSDEVYWKTIAYSYTSSGLGHSKNSIISDFINNKRPNKHFLMDEDERKFLAELPDKITIYRGCSKKEINSNKIRYSWTLDKKVAEFFAYEYANVGLTQSSDKVKSDFDIIEKTINKSEVIAYFNSRKESEILYYPK